MPTPKAAGPSDPLVLVVEDNEANLELILDLLSVYSYRTVVARNGQEAIEQVEAERPDIVLMDMRMPVMGGLEATRRIRADPKFANLPIFALTASVDEDARDEQLEAGCNERLTKPIDMRILLETMARYAKQ